MKKILAILLLTALASSASAQDGYCSIAQIRMDTPQRWTETYETQWRTVTIDAPIRVPEVDAFPIVKISQDSGPVPEDKLTAYSVVDYNDDYSFSAITDRKLNDELASPNPDRIRRRDAGFFYDGETPDILPEDAAISYEDALCFCYKEIEHLFGLHADQLYLESTDVYDGQYYFHYENGEKIWEKRANDYIGFWGFYFEQLFHGIPMMRYDGGNSYDDYFDIPHAGPPGINVAIWDSSTYWVSSVTRRELAVMYDDVPLKSFADAKAAIESEILSGHLRTVDLVKLCYLPYTDPSDPSVFWLLPAWYVEGIYTGNARLDLEPVYNEDGILVGYNGNVNDYMMVAYEANSGKLIDRRETSSKRRNVPEIVTWNDEN